MITTEKILDILEKLISFKSITPKSNGAIEYIAKLLSDAGFICDIQIFGEKESEKTTNLYARYGHSGPNICFAGHVDVVPPLNEDLWQYNPFVLNIHRDKVYGRGIVDMKGAIACAIAAVLEYLRQYPLTNSKSISFLLTSDEEGEAKYGTSMMLEYLAKKGEKIDFTILGEPTTKNILGDTIKIGRRGSINFNLTVKGKQGHVAYPDLAINPVSSLVKVANDLLNIQFDEASKFFEKTDLVITSFDVGNDVTNIIPETATMMFNVRFNDIHSSKSVAEKVLKTIAHHEMIFDLKYNSSCESFIQPYSKKMQEFAELVKEQCGMTPSIETGGGTSDARFIHKYSEVIEFGLCSGWAHKINEHTKISDLQTLYNVYYSYLYKFLLQP